ncbi:hypothetical protein FRB90_005083 [Tulasnella sp. 427]|nr:hypothetical protein FRB90_005083 [Tulasnella sp. 427]
MSHSEESTKKTQEDAQIMSHLERSFYGVRVSNAPPEWTVRDRIDICMPHIASRIQEIPSAEQTASAEASTGAFIILLYDNTDSSPSHEAALKSLTQFLPSYRWRRAHGLKKEMEVERVRRALNTWLGANGEASYAPYDPDEQEGLEATQKAEETAKPQSVDDSGAKSNLPESLDTDAQSAKDARNQESKVKMIIQSTVGASIPVMRQIIKAKVENYAAAEELLVDSKADPIPTEIDGLTPTQILDLVHKAIDRTVQCNRIIEKNTAADADRARLNRELEPVAAMADDLYRQRLGTAPSLLWKEGPEQTESEQSTDEELEEGLRRESNKEKGGCAEKEY